MYYIVETEKSFSQASTDLDAAVTGLGFGVLHVHDLGGTLRSKGITFDEECKIFEICNPAQAAKVLATDMRLNMALPCRISVFTEKGKNQDRLDQASANAFSAISGSHVTASGQRS